MEKLKNNILLTFILTAICFVSAVKQAAAKVAEDFDRPRYQLYYISTTFTESDTSKENRTGLAGAYSYPILNHIRVGGGFKVFPDVDPDTREVDIARNLFDLYASFELTYTYFFRFVGSINPVFHYEVIDYDIAGTKETKKDYQAGANLELGLEYEATVDLIFLTKLGAGFKSKDDQSYYYTAFGAGYSF